MKGKKYILLKSKIPVWLKWWWYKKGELITLKNLYLGYSRQTQTTGKNKMPLSSYDSTEQRQKIFNIGLSAGTYTVSFDLDSFDLGTNTNFNLFMALYGESQVIDKNILSINADTTTGRKYANFTINADSLITANSNIRISASSYDNGARASISNIQIETGTVATPYEQYTGDIPAPNPEYPFEIENLSSNVPIQAGNKVITFPLSEGQKMYVGSELTANGIKHTRKQIVLDGTESWQRYVISSSYNRYQYYTTISGVKYSPTDITIRSNIAKGILISDRNVPGNNNTVYTSTNTICFRIDSIITLEGWLSYLAEQYANGTPVTIEYELTEPETVAYTEAQLQAYTNLCKYFEENTVLNNYIVDGG